MNYRNAFTKFSKNVNSENWSDEFRQLMETLCFKNDNYAGYNALFPDDWQYYDNKEYQEKVLENLQKCPRQVVGDYIFSRFHDYTYWSDGQLDKFINGYFFFDRAASILLKKLAEDPPYSDDDDKHTYYDDYEDYKDYEDEIVERISHEEYRTKPDAISEVIVTVKRVDDKKIENPINVFRKIEISEPNQTLHAFVDAKKMKFDLTYTLPDEISYLMNLIQSVIKCNKWETFSPNKSGDDNNFCSVEIRYYQKPELKFTTDCTHSEMPPYWSDFVYTINHFPLKNELYIDLKDFRNEYQYGMYIYCSCYFRNNECSTYYYLTNDITIKVGDRVVVPAGMLNTEKIVTVADVEYFSKRDVPFPLYKTKSIIRKAAPDETISDDDFY